MNVIPCYMAETCEGCPLETMPAGERIVALGLADKALNHCNDDFLAMSREKREEVLAKLEAAKPDGTRLSDRVAKPDTYARIATAIHRHFDPRIETSQGN